MLRCKKTIPAFLVLVAAGSPGRAPAEEAPHGAVIPKGQERLIGEMLGQGASLPASCRLDEIAVEKWYVVARYHCGGQAARVLLDSAASPSAAVRTARFALRSDPPEAAPRALLEALAERVRKHEGEFRWEAISQGDQGNQGAGASTANAGSPAGSDDAASMAARAKLDELLPKDKREEALGLYLDLVRKLDRPRDRELAIWIAAGFTDPTRARRYAESVAHSTDPLAHYAAGVALHFSAEQAGKPAERAAVHRAAAGELRKAQPSFLADHRLILYLAQSELRSGGDAKAARELADQAVGLGERDPMAWLGRAEIEQKSEPARAVADLDRFLELKAKLRDLQAVEPGDKEQDAAVTAIRAHLAAVAAGKEKWSDRFGPLRARGPVPGPPSEAGSRDATEARLGAGLLAQGRHAEALALYTTLARRNPHHPNVVNAVVAALAPTIHSAEDADPYAKAADAHPGDAIGAFTAGAALYAAAHNSATTRQEKTALYRRSLRYLEAARPALGFEPRVLALLALDAQRTGDGATATALAEKAVALAPDDPELYVTRAEIEAARDPVAARRDLEACLAATDKLVKSGAPVGKEGRERVRQILDRLRAPGAAAPNSDELFDPVLAAASEKPRPARHAEPPVGPTAYRDAVKLYQCGRYGEALGDFMKIARSDLKYPNVFGAALASLAGDIGSPASAERYLEMAGKRPTDAPLHFIAGMAAFDAAHLRAATAADKSGWYERARTHLRQARPVLDFEPRLLAALAVTEHRLGHEPEAQALLADARKSGEALPEVLLADAELASEKDPARAARSLDRWLAAVESAEKAGDPTGPEKPERVRRVRDALAGPASARPAGGAAALFDPLPGADPFAAR